MEIGAWLDASRQRCEALARGLGGAAQGALALDGAPSIDTLCWSAASFAAGVGVGLRFGAARRGLFQRIVAAHELAHDAIGPTSALLRGRVIKVADGDTLRLLHTPTPFHASRLRDSDKVSAVALQVRLCTIDAPETAKFGKPAQPFGEAAKQHLERLVLGRMVSVRVLSRDQYGRAVGSVVRGRWPLRSHVDEDMLRTGLAEVYHGGGAVYGPRGKEHYVALELAAKRARRGMWAQGAQFESAAVFKARTVSGAK
ncbi:hypothetical protein KFE25_011387 [Diacronema lutheri]|uniref:TNase-like domain-containing protein n=1 Tax=Diacronema lutheri TaxID=2081491 RepID=A0A8J6C3B5_DIALT|nr:hypothetical protein KFE25_011387 [Diacronema lutheri]